MKFYLAASVSGGRNPEHEERLRLIARVFEELGHEITSKGFVVELSPEDSAPGRDEFGIVTRDLNKIREADGFMAEVTLPSYGAGYEQRVAEEEGKPILVLRYWSLENTRMSVFVRGTGYPRLLFSHYENEEDLREIAREFIEMYVEGRIKKERE